MQITRKQATPLGRARAIYDWVVENTVRDPTVRGCGLGDIRWMLESGSLLGKCADLNALFVGLCRAVELPARDLYGLRVAASRQFTAWGEAATSAPLSIAAPRCLWMRSDGFPSIPPTFAK